MDGDIHSHSNYCLDETGNCADRNNFTEAYNFFKMQLPERFSCAESVFKEVLRSETWKTVLNSKHRDRLKKLLPSFPENDEKEKNETLKKLIDGENFKFGNPLRQFFNKLYDGFLSPGITEVITALKKS